MRRSLKHLLVLTSLTIVYLLVFPILTGRELVIQRSWAVSAASVAVVPDSALSAGVLLPVRLRDSFGYISDEGEVIYRGAITYSVALGGRGPKVGRFALGVEQRSGHNNSIQSSPPGIPLQYCRRSSGLQTHRTGFVEAPSACGRYPQPLGDPNQVHH